MDQSKKAVNQHSVLFALLHGATYLPATWLLKNQVFSLPVAALIAIVPIITFSVFIFKYIKALSVMDEVKQRVHLEAVVIGFSLTVMLVMLLFLLGLGNVSTTTWFGYGHLVGYCWVFYFIGWFISRKKYGV
ncbi:hypothetical protein GCM10027299_26740 [Larkinella ripae]